MKAKYQGCVFLIVLLSFGCNKEQHSSSGVVEQSIKQKLLLGTPLKEVDLYLVNRGSPHSYYTNENKIHAMYLNLKNPPFGETEMLPVTFSFDASNRLTNIECKASYKVR